jgi:DedD protein
MAKDDERPQFNPKHRIAGAIILVSLAVIFVPMLLDESTPPPENQTLTQIPERDAPAETRVAVTPLTPAAEPAAPPPTTEPAAAPPAANPAAPETAAALATPEAKPAKVEAPKTEPAPKSAATAPVAEKISKGWVVQIGTFANSANADRLRERLRGLGYSVNAESVTVQGGKAVRLRVGPYREKEAAAKARTQLQKDVNIQGLVVAYP